MTQAFDKDYWESLWKEAGSDELGREVGSNPYLAREIGGLTPGTVLDAGCGEGAEAIWLAGHGWQVTAADISAEALTRAAEHAARSSVAVERVRWIEADLCVWEPDEQFDLVTTHYAHPAMPQLAFYKRISAWVAPGGTLLIVGHLHGSAAPQHGPSQEPPGHGHNAPDEASVSAERITAGLEAARWDIITADEPVRTLTNRGGATIRLADVLVRAIRR